MNLLPNSVINGVCLEVMMEIGDGLMLPDRDWRKS